MKTVLVVGAGKIGRMVAYMLDHCGDSKIRVVDSEQRAIDRLRQQTAGAEGSVMDFTDKQGLDGILADVHGVLGYRLSLAHLSETNLGESKSGEGTQALMWWKHGRIDLIEQYCRKDVELTWRLFERGFAQGHLLYRDKEDRMLRVPVSW